jgi:biopolymer transport protein ExbD
MMKMRRLARRAREREAAELNITAFMNLMVVLVPFLLITAVFSRVAVLELNLPASSDNPADAEPEGIQLEIIVRDDRLELNDRNSPAATVALPNGDDGYDLEQLSAYLVRLKEANPDKLDATVLLEPDIEYDTLVQVMDTVRVVEQEQDGELVKAELFPEISIGDAPPLDTVTTAAAD